jgi:hypothetical protein
MGSRDSLSDLPWEGKQGKIGPAWLGFQEAVNDLAAFSGNQIKLSTLKTLVTELTGLAMTVHDEVEDDVDYAGLLKIPDNMSDRLFKLKSERLILALEDFHRLLTTSGPVKKEKKEKKENAERHKRESMKAMGKATATNGKGGKGVIEINCDDDDDDAASSFGHSSEEEGDLRRHAPASSSKKDMNKEKEKEKEKEKKKKEKEKEKETEKEKEKAKAKATAKAKAEAKPKFVSKGAKAGKRERDERVEGDKLEAATTDLMRRQGKAAMLNAQAALLAAQTQAKMFENMRQQQGNANNQNLAPQGNRKRKHIVASDDEEE